MIDNCDAPESASEPEPKETRLLPAELGWDEYEPAFRRWAAYNAMQDLANRGASISPKENAAQEESLGRWVADQQRRGKLPPEAEIRGKQVQVSELLLPYQNQIARQEEEKMRGDGAYWRRIGDFSNGLKENIDTERRYTRMLNDCAVAGAAAYGKSLDQAKSDIEERFTQRYLYTPAEYYEHRLEHGDRNAPQQSPNRAEDRAGNQELRSRTGKTREAEDDRGR